MRFRLSTEMLPGIICNVKASATTTKKVREFLLFNVSLSA